MQADKTAVYVAMKAAGLPAPEAVQRAGQPQSAGNISAARHLKLTAEIQFSAHSGIGQSSQLSRVQTVREIRASDGVGPFAVGGADLPVSLNP